MSVVDSATIGLERASLPATRARSFGAIGTLLAGLIALGALLRFTTLGQQSFWLDEAATRALVGHSFGHVFSMQSSGFTLEDTPPLYFVLAWLWSQVGGLSEIGLRSFSALAGTLTIPVMWAIGTRAASARVGLIAASLTAVNPLLWWYSQEARSYSLLVLSSALWLLVLLMALERPTNQRIAGWGILSAVCLATHYFALFLIVPGAAWLLTTLFRAGALTRRKVILALGPLLVVGLELLPLALQQAISNARSNGWIAQSGSLLHRVEHIGADDVIGYGPSTHGLLGLGCLALAAVGLGLAFRVPPRERSMLKLPLMLVACAVATPVLLALMGRDYVDTRNLMLTWPALALIAATGFGCARARRIGAVLAAALAGLSIACIWSVIDNPRVQRPDWRGAARALGSVRTTRAIVSYTLAKGALSPYLSNLIDYPLKGTRIQEVDVVSPTGGWLGATPHLLSVDRLPPGFAFVRRVKTDTYTILRYRSPTALPERATALAALYSGLTSVQVMSQRP
jgi:4-amino-4-deoxy-L-arabinose transferase-like glycosyltransferase